MAAFVEDPTPSVQTGNSRPGNPPTTAPPAPPTPPAAQDAASDEAASRRGGGVGVFETLEVAFWWLGSEPAPLRIHGRRLPELPDRPIELVQLRARLARAATSQATRAAVWSYLAAQARTPGPRQDGWTVGVAGVALPELMRIVAALAPDYRGDIEDLKAAALGGFLAELRRPDLGGLRDHRLRRRLLMAAYRAGRALRDATHTPPHDSPGTPRARREARP